MRVRSSLPLIALFLAACTDHRDPTAPTFRATAAARQTVAPTGSLDQNIHTLFELFPKGLANAGETRWDNVKAKYDAGQSQPAQLRVAKDMLFELAAWVKQHQNDMNPPPNNETKTAATARLTLYMSMYVFGSPSTPVPAFLPTADAAVGLVTPNAPDTVVTPTHRAGVQLDAGSVDESTIIVVTENPSPYPANCSGPLVTKLCQYPRFYNFDEFPHKPLLKPAIFSVCHVNDGALREPLADHDRFRLAHAKPAIPAEYTPGSTIVDSIEILPYAHQTFSTCSHTDYSSADHGRGLRGFAWRLASGVGAMLTPKPAYAIDVGGGGFSVDFSPFNDVDPASKPNREVTTVSTSVATTHAGDHITFAARVTNSGSASGNPVLATIRISTSPTLTNTSTWLDTVSIPAQVPRDTASVVNYPIVVPAFLTPGTYYVGLVVDDDPLFADSTLTDNQMTVPITIDPAIGSSPTMQVGEQTVCALTSSNVSYCWGANLNRQLAQSGGDVSTPFAPTALPAFIQTDVGTGQTFCSIKADHSAMCWGRGTFGQLGNGVQGTPANAPATVLGGISWESISVGRLSACGVSLTGVGYCWGANQHGEIGDPTKPILSGSGYPQPVAIAGGLTFRSVAAGWIHACGITTSGAAYCWGSNGYGELGTGDLVDHAAPVAVTGGYQFIELSLSATSTCGVTVTHDLYCWGGNYKGQLGDGTTTNHSSPTHVASSVRFSYVTMSGGFAGPTSPVQGGWAHTCALSETGQAYCWGNNQSGQLGDGTTIDHLAPAPVGGALQFSQLGVGASFSCGRTGNQIQCWGGNSAFQLGTGNATPSLVPGVVLPPFASP